MASINSITLVGKVIGHPKPHQTKYSKYLEVKLQTEDTWRSDISKEYKVVTEVHTVRLYGKLAERTVEELEPNDKIYVEGSIKTIEKMKHVNVRTFRLMAKRSPGDLLPPDVTIEPQGKWN